MAKDLEVYPLHQVVQRDEFQGDAQVRLVGAEALHGFGPAHVREGGQLDIQHRAEHLAHHALGDIHDRRRVQKRGLDIDLGELGLAIRAQIFIAKTLRDLIVAIETRDHQQLLEQLR